MNLKIRLEDDNFIFEEWRKELDFIKFWTKMRRKGYQFNSPDDFFFWKFSDVYHFSQRRTI